MHCCIPTPTTDSKTSTGMILVTLNMPSQVKSSQVAFNAVCQEECRGGVPRTVREFHIVWRVVTLLQCDMWLIELCHCE